MSSASSRKDRNLKRKCRFGFLKLAGKSLARKEEVEHIGLPILRNDTIGSSPV